MATVALASTDGVQMHAGPTIRPLAEPLRLAAVELTELASLSDQLQGAIARLTQAQGAPDADFLTEAQAADLLSQRLAGLAAFLRAIAEMAPPDATTDVYAAVIDLTLAEQARRLGGLPAARVVVGTPDSGELQLFED